MIKLARKNVFLRKIVNSIVSKRGGGGGGGSEIVMKLLQEIFHSRIRDPINALGTHEYAHLEDERSRKDKI